MKLLYFLIVCLFGYVISDGPLLQIERGIEEFLQTNVKPDYVQKAFDNLFKNKSKSATNKAVCSSCVLVARTLLKLRRNGASRETLVEFGTNACLWFFTNKEPFCRGYIEMDMDAAIYIADKNPDLTAEHICAIRLQEYDCTDPQYDPWTVNIPPRISEVKLPVSNDTSEEIVLHLTDFHYDPYYEPGSNTKCDYFICCQSTDGKATTPENGAGYWGDYNQCDTPWHSILDLLKHIVKQHPKIDRVYYTGDIVSHQIWATSKNLSLDSIKKVLGELKNTFKSIPVYPVLGNHEAHPSDLFSSENVTQDGLSTKWLLDVVAEEWATWLPNEAQSTINKGGFYSVLAKPGFRIIGLNSNICFTVNLWLLHNNKDPYGQLQWLVDTLAEAERNSERVHILGHVPPGDKTCLKQWNHEFRRIVDRFSHIIVGQFNGHTHLDELRVFYSLENPTKVVNVAFNGGSFTTFVANNPNYRVYNVGSSSWRVNDYEQWTYSIKEANETPDQDPNWFKLYSFREAYGLNELVPEAYNELIQKMSSNTSLIEQYRRFQVRDSEVALKGSCTKECLADIFCSISNVEFEDSIQCKSFKGKFYKI